MPSDVPETRRAAALRVVAVATSFPRRDGDGSGQFIASWAGALRAAGADVRVVAPHAPGLEEAASVGGVPVTRFRYAPDGFERVAYGPGIMSNVRHDWRAAAALPSFVAGMRRATRVAASGADVLHVHWAQNAAFTGSAAGDTPLVITVHGSDVALATGGGIMGALFRRAAERASAVIAVSAQLAEEVAPLLPPGMTPDVVPSGVPASLLARPRPPHRTSGGPAEVVFVGRLVPEKGTAELAAAFADLGDEARLTVVGEGPERGRMEARLAAAGAAGRVRFTGALAHEAALDAMAAADLVVVPSLREGCGVVALEAAALGVPVVATATGVMAEVACEKAVVPPGDAPALAAAMREMLAAPALRENCSAAGRERVAAGFTWDVIARSTLAVYERVLGSGA